MNQLIWAMKAIFCPMFPNVGITVSQPEQKTNGHGNLQDHSVGGQYERVPVIIIFIIIPNIG